MMKSIHQKKGTAIPKDTEHLYNLLDTEYYNKQIKQCNTVQEIEQVVKDTKHAKAIAQSILAQRTKPQFFFYDDIPEANDNGYIPITVELTDDQKAQHKAHFEYWG